jgi:uncharacterized protein YhaN
MSVYIKEIHVRNLGPVDHFSFHLGKLNLIYGHNENGKTYLAEFIIRSLFRNPHGWKVRGELGTGKVILSGLPDSVSQEFSPGSPNKLEDCWDEQNKGLPPDFSKLLVVKGAEVEIAKVDGGVDRAVIKRLLSSKEILDRIQGKISKTILESKLQSGVITGPKRGDLSLRTQLEQKIRLFDDLFRQIDTAYSGSRQQNLNKKKEGLIQKLEEQTKAKQYLAYNVSIEIKNLQGQRSDIATTKVHETKSHLTLCLQKKAECELKQKHLHDAEKASRHYEWLKQAHDLYQSILEQKIAKPKPFFLVLSGLLLVATGVLTYLQMTPWALGLLSGGLLCGVLHMVASHKYLSRILPNNELQNLEQTFFEKFQMELTGLPLIQELLAGCEEDYNAAKLLQNQLADEKRQLAQLQIQVAEKIKDLTREESEQQRWDEILRNLENDGEQLDARIRDRELYHAQLNIDVTDYQKEDPRIEYSQRQYEAIEAALNAVDAEIVKEETRMNSLKQLICQQTGNDIGDPLDAVIETLRDKRHEAVIEYKMRTADILGKIAVHEIIKELRTDEDEKMLISLRSDQVQKPLYELTKRYNSIELHGDTLQVGDQFNSFALSDLSTGAQEQILLALRIGLSKKIMNQDSLFLILDDAFQYSDWQRRKLLVKMMIDLIRAGWQIIYFTMDDNIRALFDEKGKKLGSDYRYMELTGDETRFSEKQIGLF